MKLTISKNANINYLARIVQVDTFHPHPNADKLKLCTVEGYIISTGIDSVEGIYVYFPVECVINPKFLKYHNLYRKKELNQNPEQSGIDLDAPGYEQVLGYEQKIIEDSERVKKY